MERRSGSNGSRSREGWFFSFPLLVCLAALAQPSSLSAQSAIIADNSNSSNKSAVYFQQEKAPIKLRSLEEANGESTSGEEGAKQVNIIVPAAAPISLKMRNVEIPFPPTPDSVVSKGLLYSDDRGGHWHEYGPARPASEGDSFEFSAPADGEYWFALHLIHQDGSDSASRAQKYVIETGAGTAVNPGGSSPSYAAEIPAGDKMGEGLLKLTQASTSAQQTGATGSDALTARLNEQGGSTPAGTTGLANNGDHAAIPFPGKFNWVESGKTQDGDPGFKITWFRPQDIGGEKAEGKIRIERAPSPDGPWTPVAEDAADLDINGYGYWFSGKEGDAEDFYLRTVAVMKTESGETEWVDSLPNPLSFQKKEPQKNSSHFSNVSMERPADRESKSDSSIKAWSDSGSESGTETKIADRNTRSAVVDRTSSVSQSETSAHRLENTGSGSHERQRPRLTDPQQVSVNPIFHFGLGVFTGKDRSGNRLPDYSDTGAVSGTAAESVSEIPPPPAKRPIWMTKQQYEEEIQYYESEVARVRNAEAQRDLMEKQRKEMQMTAQGGIPGGQKATISDSQGNQINITEGSVVYQDEKGNLSTTPFPGQMTSNIGDMSFPDQSFSGGQPIVDGQPISMNGQPIPMNGQPIPMNGQPIYDPNALNSFGDPYTNKEQTLGGTTYDMTDVPNQSLLPSSLPPKPDSQQ